MLPKGDGRTTSDADVAELSTLTPLLLDPVDVFNCNVRKNSNHTVNNYTAKAFGSFTGGTVALKCETAEDGWIHIKRQHADQWQYKLDRVAGTGTWDDLMGFAVKEALSHPGTIANGGQGKLCFSTPIELHRGTTVVKFNPTVIISMNNRKVITAYPSNRQQCHG